MNNLALALQEDDTLVADTIDFGDGDGGGGPSCDEFSVLLIWFLSQRVKKRGELISAALKADLIGAIQDTADPETAFELASGLSDDDDDDEPLPTPVTIILDGR